MRELERIKKEREEDAARKASEDKARTDAEKKDAMLRGNPLLAGGGFSVKRRWDDDVVFRNQARTEPAAKKVRALIRRLRSPIHRLCCFCVCVWSWLAHEPCRVLRRAGLLPVSPWLACSGAEVRRVCLQYGAAHCALLGTQGGGDLGLAGGGGDPIEGPRTEAGTDRDSSGAP
jgi:hypothetical protein